MALYQVHWSNESHELNHCYEYTFQSFELSCCLCSRTFSPFCRKMCSPPCCPTCCRISGLWRTDDIICACTRTFLLAKRPSSGWEGNQSVAWNDLRVCSCVPSYVGGRSAYGLSKAEALAFGNILLSEQYIHHATNDHHFKVHAIEQGDGKRELG